MFIVAFLIVGLVLIVIAIFFGQSPNDPGMLVIGDMFRID